MTKNKQSSTKLEPTTLLLDHELELEEITDPKGVKGLDSKRARESISYFAYWYLGIKPQRFQHMIFKELEKGNKRIAVIASRQIGKSLAYQVAALWAAFYNKFPSGPSSNNKNTKVIIVSKDDEASKKFMGEIRKLIYAGDAHIYNLTGGNSKTFFSRRIDTKAENTKSAISFLPRGGSSTGANIKCFPPTGAIRGNTGDLVVVDEAAFIEDEIFHEDIKKTLSRTDGYLMISSTPKGQSGFFFQIMDPMGAFKIHEYKRFSFPRSVCEDPNQLKMIEQDFIFAERTGNMRSFRQEYECSFEADNQSFISSEKIDEMDDDSLSLVYEYKENPSVMAIDYGMSSSRTVVTVSAMEDHKKPYRLLWQKEFEEGFNEVELMNPVNDFSVQTLHQRFNIQAIVVDDCLVAGTEVLMADRTRKNIEDVEVGEFVLSYDFKKDCYVDKPVIRTISTGDRKTYRVNFRNGTSVVTSGNHKWFVKNKRSNKVSVTTTKELDPKTQYIPVALNMPSKGEEPVTEEEAYLLGMYIAEGHKRPTRKAFFISQLKESGRDKIKKALEKTNWVWQENGKGFYLSDVFELKQLFDECGVGAENKRIPEEVFRWESWLQEAVYEGLMDGDGCRQAERKDKRGFKVSETESYYTSSTQLNDDFRLLALMLNKPTHYRMRIHSGFGSIKQQYEPVWCEGSAMNSGRLYVASIEEEGYQPTFDIEVEGTHSFVLPESGVITHNCPQGFTTNKQLEDKGYYVLRFNFRSDQADRNRGYSGFRSLIHQEKVRIPYIEELILQLKQLEVTSGKIHESIGKPRGGRDDRADSFMMSLYPWIREELGDEGFETTNASEFEEKMDSPYGRVDTQARQLGIYDIHKKGAEIKKMAEEFGDEYKLWHG